MEDDNLAGFLDGFRPIGSLEHIEIDPAGDLVARKIPKRPKDSADAGPLVGSGMIDQIAGDAEEG